MTSKAQIKANAKYRKKHIHQFNLQFFPDDNDLYDWFKQQPNKNKLVKDLLRSKMEHTK